VQFISNNKNVVNGRPHKTHIIEKMQTANENGLIRYAIRHKLFDDKLDQ